MSWKRNAIETACWLASRIAPRARTMPDNPRSIFVLRNNDIGDLLVVQSDGIGEAMNGNQEQFGEERLQSILLQQKHRSAEEIIDTVVKEVRNHAGAHPQSDDITIMVIKRVQ